MAAQEGPVFSVTDKNGEVDILYRPQPYQLTYHASIIPNYLMIGPRGTGKSLSIRMDSHMRSMAVKGFRYITLRRTMRELKKSHLSYIGNEMERLGGYFNKTDSEAHYPNGSLGFFGHCYDEKTEVLTEKRGFVTFSDLREGEKIATLEPESQSLIFDCPSAYMRRFVSEDLVRINPTNGPDLLVTEDHPMMLWDHRGNQVTFPAWRSKYRDHGRKPLQFRRTVKSWVGVERETFKLESVDRGFVTKRTIAMDDWLEFLGWFISEGSATTYLQKPRNIPVYSVNISQKKNSGVISWLTHLLLCWGFTVHQKPRPNGLEVLSVTQKQLYMNLAPLGKAADKYVPEYVKNLSVRQINIFLKSLFEGDGSSKDGEWVKYTTVSKRLADDVQELLFRIGKCGTICVRKGTPAHKKTVYDVVLSHRNMSRAFRPQDAKSEFYEGYVYDVTMPNSPIILVRRNGRIVWGHNCESDADVDKHLGGQYDLVNFDEATTFKREIFLKISATARVPEGSGRLALVRGGTNPLGEGADFINKYFIKHLPDEGDDGFEDYDPADWGVLDTTFTDNKYIDEKQYRKRFSHFPAHIRKAWLDGLWVSEDAYFADFEITKDGKPWHVITRPPEVGGFPFLQLGWIRIYRALDWGYSPDPAVCLWIAMLPSGRAIVFKERKWEATDVGQVAADIIRESQGMNISETFCDPTLFTIGKGNGYTIGESFESEGVSLSPSVNDRALAGYAIHECLNKVVDGEPRVQMMAATGRVGMGVPYLIRTIQEMRTDKKDPRKIADGDDHAVIAFAYFCMGKAPASTNPDRIIVPKWMRRPTMGVGVRRFSRR